MAIICMILGSEATVLVIVTLMTVVASVCLRRCKIWSDYIRGETEAWVLCFERLETIRFLFLAGTKWYSSRNFCDLLTLLCCNVVSSLRPRILLVRLSRHVTKTRWVWTEFDGIATCCNTKKPRRGLIQTWPLWWAGHQRLCSSDSFSVRSNTTPKTLYLLLCVYWTCCWACCAIRDEYVHLDSINQIQTYLITCTWCHPKFWGQDPCS